MDWRDILIILGIVTVVSLVIGVYKESLKDVNPIYYEEVAK